MPVGKEEATAGSVPAPVSPAHAIRRVVFLNHANPEDNVFALWLGARLTAAGYHVWSDLLQLVGGERFWKDINEAIRHHTAVFLPILSNASIDPAKAIADTASILAFCRERLASYKVPVRLVIRSAAEFPRTPTGKIHKPRLRQELAAEITT